MKMLEFYKHLLTAGNCIVDKDGMVSGAMKGHTTPLLVGGKRMVLPTKEHLDNPDPDSRVNFHPLSENILSGESKVMEKFRSTINIRLNYVLGSLMEELLRIVTSVKMHPKLSPSQSEMLSKVKGADEKTLTVFSNLLKAMGVSSKDKCIVHIFLRRGGLVGGKSYRRAAIVSFPLYEELTAMTKETKQVYGVTLRTKDRDAIMSLMEFVIPGIELPHGYDKGSQCDIAPFLDALMKGLMGIAGNINALVDEYKPFLEAADEYRYDDEWVSVFDNLAQMLPEIRMVPMQAGNEGHKDPRTGVATTGTPALTNVQPAPAPATIAYPAAMPPPGFQAYPTAGFQAPATPGLVKNDSGKIDFAASLRNNPQLAAQVGFSAYGQPPMGFQQPPPGPMAARQNAPRWDQVHQPMALGYPTQPPGYPQQQMQPQYGYPAVQGLGSGI